MEKPTSRRTGTLVGYYLWTRDRYGIAGHLFDTLEEAREQKRRVVRRMVRQYRLDIVLAIALDKSIRIGEIRTHGPEQAKKG